MSFCVQGDPFYLGQLKCQEELWGEREIGKMYEKVQQENQLGIAGLMVGNNLVHQRWGQVRDFYFAMGIGRQIRRQKPRCAIAIPPDCKFS